MEWTTMVKGVDMDINMHVFIYLNIFTLQLWGAHDVKFGRATFMMRNRSDGGNKYGIGVECVDTG